MFKRTLGLLYLLCVLGQIKSTSSIQRCVQKAPVKTRWHDLKRKMTHKVTSVLDYDVCIILNIMVVGQYCYIAILVNNESLGTIFLATAKICLNAECLLYIFVLHSPFVFLFFPSDSFWFKTLPFLVSLQLLTFLISLFLIGDHTQIFVFPSLMLLV